MSEELTDIQLSFDSFFKEANNVLSIQLVPSNIDKVRKAFFRKKFNPEFTYDGATFNQKKYAILMQNVRLPEKSGNKDVNTLFERTHKELNQRGRMVFAQGSSDFTKYAKKMYGVPKESLIKKAEEILHESDKKEVSPRIHANQVLQKLRKGFQQVNIKGWRIKKDDIPTSAVVSLSNRTVTLKKRERMQERYVDRLTVHEIGTHVVRYENGCLQPLEIFNYGFPGYIATEEGLAAYTEEQSGFMSQNILKNYAGRVLAVDLAQKGDFIEVYSYLKQFFNRSTSFKLAMRAKRGLSDTSAPGGFSKDFVYFKGFLDVKKFAKNHDIIDLYYGKYGIKDVDFVKKLTFLKKPEFFPKYIQDKMKVEQKEETISEVISNNL